MMTFKNLKEINDAIRDGLRNSKVKLNAADAEKIKTSVREELELVASFDFPDELPDDYPGRTD